MSAPLFPPLWDNPYGQGPQPAQPPVPASVPPPAPPDITGPNWMPQGLPPHLKQMLNVPDFPVEQQAPEAPIQHRSPLKAGLMTALQMIPMIRPGGSFERPPSALSVFSGIAAPIAARSLAAGMEQQEQNAYAPQALAAERESQRVKALNESAVKTWDIRTKAMLRAAEETGQMVPMPYPMAVKMGSPERAGELIDPQLLKWWLESDPDHVQMKAYNEQLGKNKAGRDIPPPKSGKPEPPSPSDALLRQAFEYKVRTGKDWVGGMGLAGFKQAVGEWGAKHYPNLNAALVQGTTQASQKALSTITSNKHAISAFSSFADRNATRLSGLLNNIPEASSAWLNKPIREVLRKGTSDPWVGAFRAQLDIVQKDYAKLTTQTNLTGIIQEGEINQLRDLVNSNLPVKTLLKILEQYKADGENRLQTLNEEEALIKANLNRPIEELGGGGPAPARADSLAAPSRGYVTLRNKKTGQTADGPGGAQVDAWLKQNPDWEVQK